MIHLTYTFRPTAKARSDLSQFWSWTKDREGWFYGGLEMVLGTQWYVRTIGVDVHCIDHIVSFADEAAWGAYRTELSRRGRSPEWEARRVEQDLWFEILSASILSDPPVQIGISRARHQGRLP